MGHESLGSLESRIGDLSVLKKLRASFELQLETEGSSSIETWLSKVSFTERSGLFRELLDAEIRFHQQHGKEPLFEEYLARFPDFEREIQSVFESHELRPPQGSNDKSMESTVDVTPAAASRIEGSTQWGGGDFVGRYRLESFLGRGAFGEVWKALDPELMRPVAIKLPRREVLDGHDLMSKFRDEARRAASLKDDGIVPVFDIGHVGAGAFIVSEFINGPTLAQRMKSGPIARAECVRIIALLARSLHQAHLAGLVHRDMKPSNVLLRPDGTPAITDFGLAISEDEQLIAPDGVVGTAAYMSPEQARGEGRLVDGRSDLYSLGIMFFQLLTGRLPFQFKTSRDCLDQIIRREVRPPRSIDDTIPVELERICLRCLEKEVSKRYSTGRDLADDLQKWIALQQPVSHRGHLAIATLALLLAGVGLFAFGSKNKVTAIPSVEDPTVTLDQRGQRLELLGQPLDEIATLKGDATDFLHLDNVERTLTLRSERNLWVLAANDRGRPPLSIRGTMLVDGWIGSAGFVWGLSNDPKAFPARNPQCFAILLERYDPNGPVKLSLKQLFIDEFLQGSRWVNHVKTLAEAPVKGPVNRFQALEVVLHETGVEVWIDGQVVWKPEIVDAKALQEFMSAEGAVGLAGRGKTVVFREATVMFQDSKGKAN